jgi:hypothetical protein
MILCSADLKEKVNKRGQIGKATVTIIITVTADIIETTTTIQHHT